MKTRLERKKSKIASNVSVHFLNNPIMSYYSVYLFKFFFSLQHEEARAQFRNGHFFILSEIMYIFEIIIFKFEMFSQMPKFNQFQKFFNLRCR